MKASRACKTPHLPKKFVLRLPPSVHEKIFLIAKQHRRSMNAEIIHHLERMLPSLPINEIQPSSVGADLIDEKHCLTLLRTLPAHKRTTLVALLENLSD